nr:RIP metalloprotease RseP [uncultured Gellertiella sp.]
MTVFAGLFGLLTGEIVPFVLILSLLVFVHEMGHYLVGRWSGIGITVFSIGFGPEIVGRTDKHGTRWKLSLIPLGGYVKFYGDEDASSKPDTEALEELSPEERARTFAGAPLGRRAATVLAGPVANFLLAITIFTLLFSIYGRPIADPVVASLVPGSAAEKAGILAGDLLVSIDGSPVVTFEDVRRYVSIRPDQSIMISVRRAGQVVGVALVPERKEIKDGFGNKSEVGVIGIITDDKAGKFRLEHFTPVEAAGEAVRESWQIVTGTFDYLHNVVTGRMKADQLGGPIRVAQASGQMASIGLSALLQLAAVLSVSIGLLNLMPIPVLDGGHLFFYLVEALRGKPLSPRVQGIAFRIGFAIVLTLMVFTTINDISARFG